MNTIKRNFIYNSLYQILIMFIPLITTPYISRVLGAEGVGTYSYAYSIASYFVMFIMLGLNNYGNREIAKSKDDKNKLSINFWNIYFMQFMTGIIMNILYIFYCFTISSDMYVSFSVGAYVLSGILDINWFFFGMEKFKLTVIRNTTIKILTTICIFVFIKSRNDILVYCLIMTLGMLLSQIVLWPYLFKEVNVVKPKWEEIKKHIKPNMFLFLTVIAVSLFKVMDKVMLGLMTTKEQVGFYESSEKIIQIPTALITSLGTVMLPRMSNLVNKKSNEENSLIYKSILFAMFLSSSMCFGIMGVSKEFVPLFYGKGYETCISLYLILLPSCLFLAFANVIRTQYLLPHGIDKPYVISAFIGAGVNIVINILLIPLYGAIGAAIGTLVAEGMVCIYQSYSACKYLEIKKYIEKSIPFLTSGLIMFSILYLINFNYDSIVSISLKIILGILIYFGVLFTQVIIIKKFEI